MCNICYTIVVSYLCVVPVRVFDAPDCCTQCTQVLIRRVAEHILGIIKRFITVVVMKKNWYELLCFLKLILKVVSLLS